MKTHFVSTFLFLLFFLQIDSNACSCRFDKYLTIEEYNESAFIFIGRIIRIDTVITFDKKQQVFFLLDTLYKGNPKTDTIVVEAPISAGMCGIRFTLNEQLLIFSSYSNDFVNGKETNDRKLHTSLCFRNCRITTARSQTAEIIWIHNLQFLKQIQQHKNFTFDQYYLSNKSFFHQSSPDTLYAKGTIKNGMAVGTWYYYNSDKSLKKETTFTPDGFVKETTVYHSNGNIHYKIIYDVYGKIESYIEFEESGTIKKQEYTNITSTGVREKAYYKPSGIAIVITY